jgi:hypothetical protein
MVEDINRCVGHDLTVLSHQGLASRFDDPVAPVALDPHDLAPGRCAARRPGHTSRAGSRSLPPPRPYTLSPAPTTPLADLQRRLRT